MKIKQRIKKALYGFFQNEINDYLGMQIPSGITEVKVVDGHGAKIFRKEVIIPDYERLYPNSFNRDSKPMDRFSNAIENIKKELIEEIIESGFIEVDSKELFSPKQFGGKTVRVSIAVANMNSNKW